VIPLWHVYMKLDRRDPRWSMFGDGDETCVAQCTSPEAVAAVKRLFSPTPLETWPVNREARR
jgi:hypothetical protein